LKVIPVIDVLNGVVVHAVKGKRKEYKPVKSVLTRSVEPVEVAQTFKALGFSELYLADLDAIMGKQQPSICLYKSIAEATGLKLMVDAGITDLSLTEKILNNKVTKIIIGTETLKSKNFVQQAIQQFGAERIIISLDLMEGKVLAKSDFDGTTDALGLLSEFKAMGVLEFVVLDLSRVGSGEGVNVEFLKLVLKNMRSGVHVGGGVRNLDDLELLKKIGVSGVLLATALHSAKIAIGDLKKANLL
jgi:phosphoribosylformimino-5-aminoimidazole carboxamide ribotide isomerase